MKTIRFALTLFTLTFFSGVASAQIMPTYQAPRPAPRPSTTLSEPQPNPNSAADLTAIILNSERTQNADSLLLAYGQAVTNPQLARAVIAQLLNSYYQMRNQAQTAEQATQAVAEANLRFQVLHAAQNQILVQQNQQLLAQNAQIVSLLQQQVRANGGVPRR